MNFCQFLDGLDRLIEILKFSRRKIIAKQKEML